MSALAYLLTWTTYGTWLRGDPRGSVVDENRWGFPYAEPDLELSNADARRRRNEATVLSHDMRRAAHNAIESVCEHRGWRLHAANVRSNHVHVVVSANVPPEKVMVDLKAWATRALREAGLVSHERRPGTTHGSTRYLFDHESLAKAVDYVVRHQDMKGER